MKPHPVQLVVFFCFLFLFHASAATLYVDLNSTNPVPPYADWSTAATNIQDAVDASSDGDQIWVNDGVYATGGRTVNGYALTNRVVIDKAVTVQSVNGLAKTIIQGYQMPGTINGDNAVRCVYLMDGAVLDGFTLTKGATRKLAGDASLEQSGGGVWCQSTNVLVSNCIIVANACFWWGAGAYRGTLNNCVVSDNMNLETSPGGGGGAAFSTLVNCTISGNLTLATQSGTGGGAFSCILSNCVVSGNTDGGVSSSTLYNCVISSNTTANSGGGAYQSTLNNCILCNNLATNGGSGGGASDCTLNFCTISNNAAIWGGGVISSIAQGQNNVVVGNSATRYGGGCVFATNANLSNWLFISNSAATDGGGLYLTQPGATMSGCTFTGNSAGRYGGGLSGVFPSLNNVTNCIFTGNTAGGFGGGAYEAMLNNCTVTENRAGWGGGVYGGVNNCLISGNYATTNGGGIYSAAVIAYNTIFSNNAAANGGGAYLGNFSNCTFVANLALTNGGGLYAAGGTVKNCFIISNQATFGGGGYNGTYFGCNIMGNSATNSGGGIYISSPGFAATNCVFGNSSAINDGGGAYGGAFGHCTFFGNVAANGGGTYSSTLNRCILTNNCAASNGGGTYGSSSVNCLLAGNAANNGGGNYSAALSSCTVADNVATNAGGGVFALSAQGITSCIIYDNTAPVGMNYSGGSYVACCTIPLPSGGISNITNDPVFVNFAAGNFRLQTNSPCINSGSGSSGSIDLDGRPRVVGGRPDIGAYEFQGAGMGEFIGWLQQYGLPTDGSADYVDSDGDGMNNWQEWIAGTNPTNALSVLKMTTVSLTTNPSGLVVNWQSVNTRTYYLQSSTNLAALPAFLTIQSNIVGQAGTTSYTDTNAVGAGPYFYRVGVQ